MSVHRPTRSGAAGVPHLVRVVIVDDHPVVRRGLVELLNEGPGLSVCGEAESAAQALSVIAARRPDLVIVDLALGDEDGLNLVAEITKSYPSIRVMVLSGHDERLYADRALKAGALGYVMKEQAADELLSAARRVASGRSYLSEATTERILTAMGGARRAGELPIDRLSDRERHVLRLIGRGLSTRDIAAHLTLSVKTVESHYAHIKGKLGLRTGRDLTRVAVKWEDSGSI